MTEIKTGFDLYQAVIGLIADAVVKGDLELEDVLPKLALAQSWADGFVTSKLNRVEDPAFERAET